MITAKQNQKFPFHFLSAPPTPPAEENKKGKENFWFFYATEGNGRCAHHSSSGFNSKYIRTSFNTHRFRKSVRQGVIFLTEGVGVSLPTGAVYLLGMFFTPKLEPTLKSFSNPTRKRPTLSTLRFRRLKRRVWDSNPRTIFKTVTG